MRVCRVETDYGARRRRNNGTRASKASASTSVNALELRRDSWNALSRATDAASTQLVVDATAREYRRESGFPACEVGGRAPDITASAHAHDRVKRPPGIRSQPEPIDPFTQTDQRHGGMLANAARPVTPANEG